MKYLLLFLVASPLALLAQLKGTITDSEAPIQGATISIKENSQGTSSNADGKYEFKINKPGTYTITVYNLGYKTLTKKVNIQSFPYQVDFVLESLSEEIEEVVIRNTGNPADRIIKAAIKAKEANRKKYDKYQVDFYSKGILKLVDMPKKILGKRIDEDKELMDDLMLDSSRSSIVYLSETMSEVYFERPNNFKEIVKASKVSGNDNGYSFNSARGANFDFYANNVLLLDYIVSPLSNQAFSYYNFRLEQSFESGKHTIYKIRVNPKRMNDAVTYGTIYIIDDSWEIYAVDLSVKGTSVNQPVVDSINVKQQYVYHETDRAWIKQSQNINLLLSIFGIKIGGYFNQVFNNYQFVNKFSKGTFGKTIIKIEENSNKMTDSFWDINRPIVLKNEEVRDYERRDSIREARTSAAYLDSLDQIRNKFKPRNIISGYTYRNTAKKTRYGYSLLDNITATSFNAVQGVTAKGKVFARKDTEFGYTSFSSDIMYGFSDKKLRYFGTIDHKFDSKYFKKLSLEGGSVVTQFNRAEPIDATINMLASLLFKENFIKVYQRDYARLSYQQTLLNGLSFRIGIEHNQRSPLFIHSDYSFFNKEKTYASNNPLDESDYTQAPFDKHQLTKWDLTAVIRPGQKIIDRPDGIRYTSNRNMPEITLGFQQAFASDHDFLRLDAKVNQNIYFGNKGTTEIALNGGKFFNNQDMTFIDYKHFNGNQTHVTRGSTGYMNQFKILPYYTQSTNKQYFETHLEHNFKGFILNKIPLINKLGWSEIIGHHHFSTPDRSSYHEFSVGLDNIGWGKYRIFRVDYVKSYQGSLRNDGILIGVKLF